ncbi:hypothetical protein B7P34_01945 [Streptosporangium nondiastaticum]|uniref:Uncharacterized protein n=1 Tax=Streptosporangium nondiastaticum TaxID=35764 RepID=A0A9X7JV86_9ACTN|nr:hypothetical protein [Streptosporangium nondiastaticum]PSJ30346.1 hypothetical protein B7P34_01945 [Streptosporangium nondiastaticum]
MSAATLLTLAVAATSTPDPGIDWPATSASRIAGDGERGIDWPLSPAPATASAAGIRDGGTGAVDWS